MEALRNKIISRGTVYLLRSIKLMEKLTLIKRTLESELF